MHHLRSSKLLPFNRYTFQLTPLRIAISIAFTGLSVVHASTALAADQNIQQQVYQYNIDAGPLAEVINLFASASGLALTFEADTLKDIQSQGLHGQFTIQQGFSKLLSENGLQAVKSDDGTYIIRKSSKSSSTEEPATLPEVAVKSKADSGSGLQPAYAGGQVAKGGKAGFLGNKSIMDTPFNSTSYTSQTIQDQQARSVLDVVQNDASVRVVSPQSNGSEVFYIRGFSVSNQDISFDGMYGILPYWRGSVAAAERVEVLKGPNAFLNGMAPSGSVGGAINIVPKRAGDTPLTQLTASYISGSNFGGQVDIGRRFGPDNSFGIRVNGVYRDGDTNRTSQELGETAIALDYRGDRGRAWIDVGYQNLQTDKVEGLMGLAANASVPSPPSASKFYYQSWTTWKNETTYGVVRGEYDVKPNLTVYAAAGQRHFRDNYLFPFGFGLTNPGSFTEGFARASSWYDNTSSEVGLRGQFETGSVQHRVNIGLTSFNQDSGVKSGVVPTHASNIYSPTDITEPAMASLGHIPKTGQLDLVSMAIADTLSMFDDSVQLILGARKQQVDVDAWDATTGAKTASYSRDAVTPSVGVVLKPVSNLSLYSNYIEGLSQGPVPTPTAFNNTQVFAPIKSKQFEVGAKYDFGKLMATISLFEIKRPSGFTDPTTNIFGVDGEQRNRGAELNVFGEITENVRLLAGGMLLDAKQTKTQGGTFDGNYAVNSPKFTANIGTEWDTSFIQGFTVNARVVYTDAAYIDAANTQEIPSWTRFDLGARYHFKAGDKPVVIRANIENVFDRSYWMSSSLYRGNPRTLTLSATVNF